MMSHNSIHIRKARENDLQAIAKLVEKAPWAAAISNSFTHADIMKRCKTQISTPNNHLIVAELDGTIIGYTTLHIFPAVYMPVDEAMISDLFVLEEYTAKGAGALLLAHLEKIASEHGAIVALYNNNTRVPSRSDFYDAHKWENAKHLDVYIKKLGKSAQLIDF